MASGSRLDSFGGRFECERVAMRRKRKADSGADPDRPKDIHDRRFDRVRALLVRVADDGWEHRALGRFAPTKGPGNKLWPNM